MTETPFDIFEFPKIYPHKFGEQPGINAEDLKLVTDGIRLSSETDPFGKPKGLVLIVVGDSHIPREKPQDEPTIMMEPYKTVSRLDPRNPKRYTDERQVGFASTWFAEANEIRGQAEANKDFLDRGYLLLVVHVGDVGADAEQTGDMENAFYTVAEGILSTQGVKAVMLPGDHEFDRKRHGGQVREKEMELLGGRGWFFQRVGDKHLVVGVTTSLLGGVDISDEKMAEWKGRQDRMLEEVRRIANSEERKLIMLGHEGDRLIAWSEDAGVEVEATVSGHKHKGNISRTKRRGVRAVVGAPTIGAFGLEVNITPSLIKVLVDGNKDLSPADITQIRVDPGKIEGLL